MNSRSSCFGAWRIWSLEISGAVKVRCNWLPGSRGVFSPPEGLQRPGDSVWHQAAFFLSERLAMQETSWNLSCCAIQCYHHHSQYIPDKSCRLACGFYLASWTDLSDAVMSWCFFGLKCEVCVSFLSCGFVAATLRDPLKELAQNDPSATWIQSNHESSGWRMPKGYIVITEALGKHLAVFFNQQA